MTSPTYKPINKASDEILQECDLVRTPVEQFDIKASSMISGAQAIVNENTRKAVIDFILRISGARKVTLNEIQTEIDKAFPRNQSLPIDEYRTAISLQDAFGLLKNLPKDQTLTLQELKDTIRKTTEASLPVSLDANDRTTAIATFCQFLDQLDMTIGYVKNALDAMPEGSSNQKRIVDAVQKILESHLKLLLTNYRPRIPRKKQELYHADSLDRAVIDKLHAWAHQQILLLFSR